MFAIDGDGIVGYRLNEAETAWPCDRKHLGGGSADISLVVVGTENGNVQAVNPTSGDRFWQGDVTGEVSRITLSPYNVWVVNSQSGLFVLGRDRVKGVHQSTQDTGWSGIVVIDDVLLLGGDNANAYWIEE